MTKKILKSKMFIFILCGILFISITVYAVTYFPSNQVTYDNKTSGLSATDVQGAIDELYNTCSDSIISGNYIYFAENIYTTNYNEPYGGSLYRITLDGNNRTELTKTYSGTRIDSVYVTKDYIYFSVNNYNSNSMGLKIPTSGSIYRITPNGNNRTEILSISNNSGIGNIYVTDDYIYYVINSFDNYNGNKNGVIYRANLNGTNSTQITTTSSYDIGSIESIVIK